MHTILNAFRVMVGLLEMDAIAIEENGSHILVYMRKPENMFCFIIPRAVMAIGSPKISVLKYENRL